MRGHAMDRVALRGGSVRLIAAGSEHGITRESSAPHADFVRAVAAHARSVVRASLHGTLLKLRAAAHRRKQNGGAALTADAEGVLTDPHDTRSRLKGSDARDPRPETEGESLDCAPLKARAADAAPADAGAVRAGAAGAPSEHAVIARARPCDARRGEADSFETVAHGAAPSHSDAVQRLNVQTVRACLVTESNCEIRLILSAVGRAKNEAVAVWHGKPPGVKGVLAAFSEPICPSGNSPAPCETPPRNLGLHHSARRLR